MNSQAVTLKKNRKIFSKILRGILISIVIYFLLFPLSFFAHIDLLSVPHTQKYGLWDWDLPEHFQIDVDGDGKPDYIDFACLHLTSVAPDKIPLELQCEDKMSGLTVGQKIVTNGWYNDSDGDYSYLFEDGNGQWKIFLHQNFQSQIFDIQKGQLLKEEKDISPFYALEAFNYLVAEYLFIVFALVISLIFRH